MTPLSLSWAFTRGLETYSSSRNIPSGLFRLESVATKSRPLTFSMISAPSLLSSKATSGVFVSVRILTWALFLRCSPESSTSLPLLVTSAAGFHLMMPCAVRKP